MAISNPQVPIVDLYTPSRPPDDASLSTYESFKVCKQIGEPFTIENLLFTLQACRKKESHSDALHLHACVCEMGMDAHEVLENHLVPMLVDCGSIHEAQRLFNKSSKRSEHSWTSLIQGYVDSGDSQHTFDLYWKMQEECIQPSHFTYVALLKGCCRWRCMEKAMAIHAFIILEGCESNLFVGSTLVDVYAKCGFLVEARVVFENLPARSMVSWTALISGYTENGYGEEALGSLEEMLLEGSRLDPVILNCGLKACSLMGALGSGQRLHAEVARKGYDGELFLANTLVDMYATCECLIEAQHVHDKLTNRDTITWTALLAGYVKNGFEKEASNCLEMMLIEGVFLDEAAFICGLKVCGTLKALTEGQGLHTKCTQQGVGTDPYVGAAVVDMYVKCGSLDEAQAAFDELHTRNVVLWNALMEGFVEYGFYERAFDCLERMQLEGVPPNNVTFVCSMKCCGAMRFKKRACDIHAQIVIKGFEEDSFVGCTILDVYVKCKLLAEAQEMFDGLLVKDVISGNALIMGYFEYGSPEDVLQCLEQMRSDSMIPTLTMYMCSLKACGSLGLLNEGQKLHAEVFMRGLESDSAVGNSLLDMYVKCGAAIEAEEMFHLLQDRDAVSWTVRILGCTERGFGETALELFQQMQLEGITPDDVLWNAMISSCAEQENDAMAPKLYARMLEQGLLPNSIIWGSLVQASSDTAALEIGKRVHAQSQEVNETILGTALVDMYCKCGSVKDAQQVFNSILVKDVVAWDALMKGYACHVEVEIVFDLLQKVNAEGIEPNGGIFLSFLTVCSHAGLVQRGQDFFETMSNVFQISPGFVHYNALLDLLGRAGLLDEAMAIIELVRVFLSDPVPWGTALGACKKWGNLELGESAFVSLVTLNDAHPEAYILMSNMYADSCGFDTD